MNKIISTLTLVAALSTAHAQHTPVADLAYSVDNGEVTITGLNNYNITDINIPPTIEGFPVTRIGSYAFNYNYGINSVVLPASVTHIEEAAFSSSQNLQSIEMPGVTYIGISAFYSCFYLTSLTLPDSLESLDDSAFYNCSSLTSITLPASLTSIGNQAFYACDSVTSITLPASLTSIGDNAFEEGYSLTSVTFLGNAPTLGSNVFLSTPATIYVYEGATGFGSTFGGRPVVVLAISPLPIDSITVENGNLIIKPTNGTDGITIEQTDDLVDGTWTTITPTIVDGCIQLPTSGTADYYRLSN